MGTTWHLLGYGLKRGIFVPLILDFTVSNFELSFLYEFCAVDSLVKFSGESSQNLGIFGIF